MFLKFDVKLRDRIWKVMGFNKTFVKLFIIYYFFRGRFIVICNCSHSFLFFLIYTNKHYLIVTSLQNNLILSLPCEILLVVYMNEFASEKCI